MNGAPLRIAFPLGLPLTPALSPKRREGIRVALANRAEQ
jgi:hypothetical protein